MSHVTDVKARPRTASCPQCRQPARLTPDNRWRPFCSERCKMVDLGAWFSERHAIPLEDADHAGSYAGAADDTGGSESVPPRGQ